jgi:hypothetical protein
MKVPQKRVKRWAKRWAKRRLSSRSCHSRRRSARKEEDSLRRQLRLRERVGAEVQRVRVVGKEDAAATVVAVKRKMRVGVAADVISELEDVGAGGAGAAVAGEAVAADEVAVDEVAEDAVVDAAARSARRRGNNKSNALFLETFFVVIIAHTPTVSLSLSLARSSYPWSVTVGADFDKT